MLITYANNIIFYAKERALSQFSIRQHIDLSLCLVTHFTDSHVILYCVFMMLNINVVCVYLMRSVLIKLPP
jgi:hypothetical protein